MTISELREICKSRELYTAALIALVGFASFGLGRLSKIEESRRPIRLIEPASAQSAAAVSSVSILEKEAASGEDPAAMEVPVLPSGGRIVASKTGTKYHYPWCSGAQRISDGNKIWFSSVEEARKAGYTPAGNCKGLK